MRQNSAAMTTHASLHKILLGRLVLVVLACITLSLLSTELKAQAFENFPDARMRDFERQRACELNQPNCLPQVRRQMEQRNRNQMWLGGMIGGVLILIFLLAARASKQKKLEQQEELRRGREASRQRQKKHAKPESDDDMPDGGSMRSRLERPRGFGRR